MCSLYITKQVTGSKYCKTVKKLKLVLLFSHFFCTLMMRLQYLHSISKNFISNVLHHILFIIFLTFYKHQFMHFRHYMSFILYVYFSLWSLGSQTWNTVFKYTPFCIPVIRPHDGQAFLFLVRTLWPYHYWI
jgi:hypothetical protein